MSPSCPQHRKGSHDWQRQCAKAQAVAILITATLLVSPCRAEDDNYSDAAASDTVLGVLQTTMTSTSYVTLILYALLLSIMGWTAILYPFVFCPKFDETVKDYTSRGVRLQGKILSMRKGRVFNPLRYCLPTRYNCYVTVEYNGIHKELAVDESAMDKLMERKDGTIDVYALPGFPQSGMLDGSYQGHEVTGRAKILHASAAALLLGLGMWTSLVSTADEIYSSPRLWKFWMVVLGHVAAFGIAYWACNFVHMTRVEALLFGTVDPDGLQEYVETHQLANRGCSRGAAELNHSLSGGTATTALADSKDEGSEKSTGDDDAKAYHAMK